MRWALFVLAALLVSCGGAGKKAPVAKVPPDDIWASMRLLEKTRKEVDEGLKAWDAAAISSSARKVSFEIRSFSEKYEALPADFLSLAEAARVKSEEVALSADGGDFGRARSAWGETLQACQKCHQVWAGPKNSYSLPPETARPEPPAPEEPPPPPPPASEPVKATKKKKKK